MCEIISTCKSRYGSSEELVEINERDLVDKARTISIQNIQPFLNSDIFKVGFGVDFNPNSMGGGYLGHVT